MNEISIGFKSLYTVNVIPHKIKAKNFRVGRQATKPLATTRKLLYIFK